MQVCKEEPLINVIEYESGDEDKSARKIVQ
jgi:hypothetical protein